MTEGNEGLFLIFFIVFCVAAALQLFYYLWYYLAPALYKPAVEVPSEKPVSVLTPQNHIVPFGLSYALSVFVFINFRGD